MPRIWEISKVMAEKGISCERAADDIARAMAKPRPPRFVRTGDNPLLFLFGELFHQLLCQNGMASLMQACPGNLSSLATTRCWSCLVSCCARM